MKLVLSFLVLSVTAVASDPAYRARVEEARQKREQSLKADGGWLTVTGLFWLKPGPNLLGSDPANDIVLPAGTPAKFGTLTLDGQGQAQFIASSPDVTLNGKPVQQAVLRYTGRADVLSSGPIDLLLLKRGERFALRLKDKGSSLRKQFTHLNWYPVDESWRLTARFVPSPTPTKLRLDTIIGETEESVSPGFAEFERNGQTWRLQAIGQGNRLFFVLRDQTSGKTTYSASRFLSADAPQPDGTVVLDFNRLENPPCAFTPYATCPLPPPQNRLALAIEAGEKKYEGSGH